MKKMMIFMILMLNIATAQISLDRTRIVFDHSQSNTQSVVISNTSKEAPFLAQTWIEDSKGNKITEPLVALPILQRINPNQEKPIKISFMGNATNLASDRESLLYFNVLGVPPKDSDSGNSVSIVIQSKLKLFYRPKGLPQYKNTGWVEEMVVTKTSKGLSIQNPTPYHIVIYGLSSGKGAKLIEKDVIISPFSTGEINVSLQGLTPYIHYINDYGGADSLGYRCSGSTCVLEK